MEQNIKLYRRGSKVIGGGFYFCCKTKDNKPILVGKVKERLEQLLLKLCEIHKLPDVALKVFPSHFHLWFGALLEDIPDHFANSVLIATNGKLKKEFNLKDDDIWHKDYHFQTVTDISKESVNQFLGELGARLGFFIPPKSR